MTGDGSGGSAEPEIDLLSNILLTFNDKFGNIDFGEDVATNTIQDYFMGDGFKIYQQFTNNDDFKKVF